MEIKVKRIARKEPSTIVKLTVYCAKDYVSRDVN